MNLNDLLHIMVDKRASDMHLKEGRPPLLRIGGKISPLDMPILSSADVAELIKALTDERLRKKFEETNEMDLAYNLEGVARFRANAFKQMGKTEIVLRAIPIKIPTLEELNLPTVLSEIALYPRGLVLVTGTTGSGKSTTLAAMISKINENYNDHIVTIEDPIEFVHMDKKSSVSQREVGLDTDSFASALKYVLRQDPDVILIGEMRDPITVGTAISAAETGHMVFSTMHTMDTTQTISRILDFFPKEQQAQTRQQLAEALRAVISLRLVRRADETGMAPAVEILVVTQTVKGYIEEGKMGQIRDLIKDGGQYGMQTFDQSLITLYKQGLITFDEARKNATSQQEIELAMKGITSSKASAQSILDNMLKEQNRKDFESSISRVKELLSSNKSREAYEMCEKLGVKYPDNKLVAEMMQTAKMSINKEEHTQNIKTIITDGLAIFKSGNLKGAILKWQEGLNFDPNNAYLKQYIRNAEERIVAVENIPKILEQGVDFYKQMRFDDAIAKWKEVLAIEPGNQNVLSYVETAEQKKREFRIKKEAEEIFARAKEESERGNDLEAMIIMKRAMSVRNSDEFKAAFEAAHRKLLSENFGEDVEAEIISEAFRKGVEKLIEEDYHTAIKEWKKAVEKRPLEKKLKSYIERVKQLLKMRLEELLQKIDEAYRARNIPEAMEYISKLQVMDPTNEQVGKYQRDLKPLVEEQAQKLYSEGIELMNSGRLAEAKNRMLAVLRIATDHMTAKKRLEEINESMDRLKGIKNG